MAKIETVKRDTVNSNLKINKNSSAVSAARKSDFRLEVQGFWKIIKNLCFRITQKLGENLIIYRKPARKLQRKIHSHSEPSKPLFTRAQPTDRLEMYILETSICNPYQFQLNRSSILSIRSHKSWKKPSEFEGICSIKNQSVWQHYC